MPRRDRAARPITILMADDDERKPGEKTPTRSANGGEEVRK